MTEIKQQISDLLAEFIEVEKSLTIDDKKLALKELEGKSTDPDFWTDQENARSVMQEIGDLKKELDWVAEIDKEIKDLVVLAEDEKLEEELVREVEKTQKKLEKLKITSYLSGKYDKKNAIVSIHAGQGGTEAMDWAEMLFRMYSRFCEKRDWALIVIDRSDGEEAGIKSITFSVSGSYAYGYLKKESGTHRLVRQSPFNADKLRQTSFALVEVLPEFWTASTPK